MIGGSRTGCGRAASNRSPAGRGYLLEVGEPPRYRLVLLEPEGLQRVVDFASLVGVLYTLGDTIPVGPEGELWRVVEERPADPPFDSTLVCERVE
jgi:hypothetical protein